MPEKQKSISLRRVIRWSIIITLIAIIVAFRLVDEIGQDVTPTQRFIVKRVIDGDTVELQGGDRLRLLSIDTPEAEEPLYEEATQFLANLALGKTARIEYANLRRDKYGRLLGYLYIDDVFVNKQILEQGLGYLYLFEDTDINRPETKELLEAQRTALAQRAGQWALAKVPEDYYMARPGSFRFHRPGCLNLSPQSSEQSRIMSTRYEALYEGLSPCRRCKP